LVIAHFLSIRFISRNGAERRQDGLSMRAWQLVIGCSDDNDEQRGL